MHLSYRSKSLELRFFSKKDGTKYPVQETRKTRIVNEPSEFKVVLSEAMKRHPDMPIEEIIGNAQAQYPYHVEGDDVSTKEEMIAALQSY